MVARWHIFAPNRRVKQMLRDVSSKNAVAMERRDRMTVVKCLHEGQMHTNIKAVLEREPKLKKQYLEACQLFNALFEDLRQIPDEERAGSHAPLRKT